MSPFPQASFLAVIPPPKGAPSARGCLLSVCTTGSSGPRFPSGDPQVPSSAPQVSCAPPEGTLPGKGRAGAVPGLGQQGGAALGGVQGTEPSVTSCPHRVTPGAPRAPVSTPSPGLFLSHTASSMDPQPSAKILYSIPGTA